MNIFGKTFLGLTGLLFATLRLSSSLPISLPFIDFILDKNEEISLGEANSVTTASQRKQTLQRGRLVSWAFPLQGVIWSRC